MIALGVDPGTLHLGWGVVRGEGNRLRHLGHGVIDCGAKLALPARLQRIATELGRVVERYQPDVGAVETLFFHKDAQAAAKLGHARGVVLLVLAQHDIEVAEYAPARIKRTVAGRGRAGKDQVAAMVRAIFAFDETPPSDAADALAVALTHLRVAPLEAALHQQRPELQKALKAGRRRNPSRRRRRT